MSVAASGPVPSPRNLLVDQALFQGLPEDELAGLAAAVRLAELSPGRCAYRAGEGADALFLVIDGEVEVVQKDDAEAGGEKRLGLLGAGELFGEGALLADRAHNSEVRATEPTRLLVIPRSHLDALFARHPSRRLRLRTLSVTRRLASVSAAFRSGG